MDISVTNEQNLLPVDTTRLASAARGVLHEAGRRGTLSIAVVDDPTIHRLNAEFLRHDYATDVLSFALEDDGERLEGEVIVSAQTAIANAAEYGWTAADELLLYVVHGVLHLVGYRDKSDADASEMRVAEQRSLAALGVTLPSPASKQEGAQPS
ncbi:MAG: rRNA maturation RNase YbeY [Planctomycetota bacterium]